MQKFIKKEGIQSFCKFANKITWQKKMSESWCTAGLGSQVAGYGSNGPSAYPMMTHAQKEDPENIVDHEDDNISDFKTWFDKIDKKSDSDKMLTRIKKNKFDTTKEKQTIPGSKKSIFPKKDTVTVWGAPRDKNYIRN